MPDKPEIPLTITMLGSGNVATHLSIALEATGFPVKTVYSRNPDHAAALAGKLKYAIPTTNLDFTQTPVTDFYFLCLADAAVAEVMEQARFPKQALILHTSGSLPRAMLNNPYSNRTGVFYPIQTFSKNQPVNIKETPIALEAADAADLDLLKVLAARISAHVLVMSGEERRRLHLAAVFACNFTNHLLGISRDLMMQNGLDPALLQPLIRATLEKAGHQDPFRVQTGPAVRGDHKVLLSQEQQLSQQPGYLEIYRLLSQSIARVRAGRPEN